MMSFSKKSSLKAEVEKADGKDNKQEKLTAAQQMTKNAGKTRQHPLLAAKTDMYADDITLYEPRITRNDRYTYWQALSAMYASGKKKKKSGFDPDSWMAKEIGIAKDTMSFPPMLIKLQAFFRSNYWDQLYLNLLLLFLLLCIFFMDHWAESMAPFLISLNANNQLLLVVALFAFLTQVIPSIAAVYFINYCYDLVEQAASQNFQEWVCVNDLIYISFLLE